MNALSGLEESILLRLSGRPGKNQTMAMAAEAMDNEVVFCALGHIMREGEDPLRWRAAWVLEKVSESRPSLLVNERDDIRQLAMRADTPSGLCRLLLGILYNIPDDGILDVAFFNFLLDRMCDLQSPPGVQAFAMKLAYRMSQVELELHDEFCCILRNMESDYYSPGLKSVIRNCLKRRK